MKKESTLGQDLILENSIWSLDLSELKIFTGLSILSQILGDQILEKVEEGVGDISFLYKLNQNINPELIEMQIAGIQVICHSGVLDNLILFKTEFHNQLRTIFGTFQRPVWAKKIHPEFYNEDNHTFENQALVFSFENENSIYFILERSENARYPNKFYFRLSILNQNPFLFFTDTKRLHLVDDIHSRTYIAGTTKLSESTAEKVLNSVQKNLNAFVEENTPHNSLFQQIEKTHLLKTDQISFYFAQSFIESIQLLSKYEQVQIYKKIFLALEDEVICGILNREEKIKIITNKKIQVFLFLTRRCKILNLSFNEFKKTESLEDYLVKMPILNSISKQDKTFKGYKVFLIHHITSEILAVIESIQKLQASSLQVMFVKYAGKIPDAYLDTLLNVQTENFFMAGLTRHLTDKNREFFTLAKYYSDIKDFQWLEEKLNQDKLNFYEAMKFISMYFFLLYLSEAKKEQRKVLLIEDGGYLAPNLNE